MVSIQFQVQRTPVGVLTEADEDEIWDLLQRIQVTDRDYLMASLRTHQQVVRLREAHTGRLIGFTAIDVLTDFMLAGRPVSVIFTSNVFVVEQYRGHNLIQRAGFEVYLRTVLRYPWRPTYWLFGGLSYKSYVLLGRNFETYWPHPQQPTPSHVNTLMDELGRHYFADRWEPHTGIVRRSSRKRLRRDVAPVGQRELRDPLIHFFAQRNPGHGEGDMLLCLAPLSLRNWSSVLRRVLSKLWIRAVGRTPQSTPVSAGGATRLVLHRFPGSSVSARET